LAVAAFAAEVVAVAVDDLAEERHFAHALSDQAADFVDDFVHRAAAFHPAAEGDDAKGAGVATAVDNRYMGGDRRLSTQGQVLDRLNAANRLRFVLYLVTLGKLFAFDHCHFGVEGFGAQVIDQRRRFAGRHKDIDIGVGVEQSLAGLDANHTAHERQCPLRVVPFPRLEAAELADGFVFGALAHDACVEDDDVGVLQVIGGAIADLL
jgi:hypothetical protein